MVEEAIIGDELQVLVVGNNTLKATLPGGVKGYEKFFDYEAKYLDETTDHIIPWDLSEDEIKEIQFSCEKAYAVTNCEICKSGYFVRDSDRKNACK